MQSNELRWKKIIMSQFQGIESDIMDLLNRFNNNDNGLIKDDLELVLENFKHLADEVEFFIDSAIENLGEIE